MASGPLGLARRTAERSIMNKDPHQPDNLQLADSQCER